MSTILIPALRVSGRATLDFYARAFDAEAVAVYGEGDRIEHAELLVEGRMFMCGTGEGEVNQPLGGSSVYVVLDDDARVDALHAQALAAGAEDLRAPYDADYGGHHMSVRDPDGNAWSFGTYRPERAG